MSSRNSNTGDEELAFAARVQALLERGLHHYTQGDVDAAVNDWEHALALDPDSELARQYLDETRRNLETLDHLAAAPGPAPAETAPEDVDQASLETLDDGWSLSDLVPGGMPAPPDDDQYAMSGTDTSARDSSPATDWDDLWTQAPTRAPTADARTAALAPTVELVLPERLGPLLESGDDLDTGTPPLVIEERSTDQDDTEAYRAYPGYPVDDGGAAPEEFADEPTVEGATLGQGTSRTGPRAADIDTLSPVARRLLEELEAYAPDAGDGDVLRRRLHWLIERARDACMLEDNEVAIEALELALAEQPDSAIAQKLIHDHLDTLIDIYERYIEDPAAVPTLAISPSELREHSIDNRAAFLLSRIDGLLTVEDILDVSGMPPLEAYRYLCGMLHRGILRLR